MHLFYDFFVFGVKTSSLAFFTTIKLCGAYSWNIMKVNVHKVKKSKWQGQGGAFFGGEGKRGNIDYFNGISSTLMKMMSSFYCCFFNHLVFSKETCLRHVFYVGDRPSLLYISQKTTASLLINMLTKRVTMVLHTLILFL